MTATFDPASLALPIMPLYNTLSEPLSPVLVQKAEYEFACGGQGKGRGKSEENFSEQESGPAFVESLCPGKDPTQGGVDQQNMLKSSSEFTGHCSHAQIIISCRKAEPRQRSLSFDYFCHFFLWNAGIAKRNTNTRRTHIPCFSVHRGGNQREPFSCVAICSDCRAV